MDEITMFTEIRPAPPEETEAVRGRARARLEGALRGPVQPGRRWRRPVLLAGAAAAAAACAAIVVPAILPAGSSGSVVTAAWAVQRDSDGTVTVTLKDVFDLGGLQQALDSAGIPARVITVPTNPPTYTGPLVAASPASQVTVSGCFYPATGSSFAPAPVQQAVVTQVTTAPGSPIRALYVIRPSAMPPGSVLLVQGVAIGGQGPRTLGQKAAADAIEVVSFPAPAVLAGDSLPPSCTWQTVATLPFKLVTGGSATK
jgi:hypothetical protein